MKLHIRKPMKDKHFFVRQFLEWWILRGNRSFKEWGSPNIPSFDCQKGFLSTKPAPDISRAQVSDNLNLTPTKVK